MDFTDPARALCTACDHRRTQPDALLCPDCLDQLGALLAKLGAGYGRLDAAPGGTGIGAGPRPPGFASRPPARVDVLILTSRHVYDPEHTGPQSIRSAVEWWADQARDAGLIAPRRAVWRGIPWALPDPLPPRTVFGECDELASVLGALARAWWCADMLAALDRAARHLRRALGEHTPTVPLGACPLPDPGLPHAVEAYDELVGNVGRILAALTFTGARCGGTLRAQAWGHPAWCTTCGTRWRPGAPLRRLGAMLGDAHLDMAGLGRYLDMPDRLATLRKWAQRDEWRRHRAGGRTVYSLADARTSWWGAYDRAHPILGPALPPELVDVAGAA